VEELKAALRELARREPEFLIDLIADAASSRRDLALKLASVVAGVVAVPLDVATKQDLRRFGEADGQAGEGGGGCQEPRGEAGEGGE
jgi:hypothetical protein